VIVLGYFVLDFSLGTCKKANEWAGFKMAVIFLLNPNPKVAKTESLGARRVPYREVYSLPEVFLLESLIFI
jgi:hypothetical protein